MRRILLVIFLIHLFAIVAHAEITAKSWAVGSFIGRYSFDDVQSLKDSPVAGLRLGYAFTPNVTLEGSLDRPFAKSSINGNRAYVSLYRLDALYHLQSQYGLIPFVGGGMGWMDMDGVGRLPIVNVGVGVKYFLTQNVALRGDLRNITAFGKNYDHSRVNNFETTVALEYVWLQQEKVMPPPPVEEPELELEPELEPAPELEQEPEFEPAPELEQEPELEPAPEFEPAPASPEVITSTLDVKFDFDRDVVRQEFKADIQKLANLMKQYPDLQIAIEGHADNQGNPESTVVYNFILSERRAGSVREALINFGVSP